MNFCVQVIKYLTVTVLFSDSFVYIIRNQNPYEDIQHNMKYFDTSNFPREHPLYCAKRRKKLGTIKVETGADPIRSFCAVRAKQYFVQMDNEEVIQRSKGLKTHIVNSLAYEDYLDAIHLAPIRSYQFRSIQSRKNNMYTIQSTKKGLCPWDDKRYQIDGIRTLAHGHWRIKSLYNEKN